MAASKPKFIFKTSQKTEHSPKPSTILFRTAAIIVCFGDFRKSMHIRTIQITAAVTCDILNIQTDTVINSMKIMRAI